MAPLFHEIYIKKLHLCLSPCWLQGSELVSILQSKSQLRGKTRRGAAWCLHPEWACCWRCCCWGQTSLIYLQPPSITRWSIHDYHAVLDFNGFNAMDQESQTPFIRSSRFRPGLSVLGQTALTNVCSAAVISGRPVPLGCFMSETFLSDGCSIISGVRGFRCKQRVISGISVIFNQVNNLCKFSRDRN